MIFLCDLTFRDYFQWYFLMSQNLSRLWKIWNTFVCVMKRSKYFYVLELWIQSCLTCDLRLKIADTHQFRISGILPISKWNWKTHFTTELNIKYFRTVYQFSNRYDAGYYKFSVNHTNANIIMPNWLDEARAFISPGPPIFLKSKRHLGSSAAEISVKLQSDKIITTSNLAASRLHKILAVRRLTT